jgi:hypothetical protein
VAAAVGAGIVPAGTTGVLATLLGTSVGLTVAGDSPVSAGGEHARPANDGKIRASAKREANEETEEFKRGEVIRSI